MKNYDLGILTFWNVPNYGTFAQAYALQKTLERMQHSSDVRQIAYLDQHHYNCYYNKPALYHLWSRRYWREKIYRLKNRQELYEKESNFKNNYLTIKHTEALTKEQIKHTPFSTIVLGSDIIWDYSISVFNRDELLFGNGLKADRMISYAASFGTVSADSVDWPAYVVNGLRKMDKISVRDKKSADIVESIVGKRPPVVLDPVWLWDFNHDHKVVLPDIDHYIIVYGQDFSETFIHNLIDFAKKHNKKIVALDCNQDHYSWCDILIKQKDLSPYQWLGYFKGADYVATSTFHGLTFGLVFQKKIAFYKTEFILAKINDFLKQTQLSTLFEDKNDVLRMLESDWDYKTINLFIEQEKVRSYTFLKEAFQ